MKQITKLAPLFATIVTLFTIMASMGFTALYLAVGPDLPEVDTIRQIRLQTPMSIYSKDGQLINEYGDIRRIPITLDQVPQDFINALLSTEDVRFYEHSGVDFKGVLRAVLKLAMTGTKSQGASTITMLVARNYYLSREKKFSRKFTEMFVAWKLESELSKNEILEIFLNKISFGHRSAGLGAASEVYYGKKLKELSLAQLATLAGIPKGQSVFNPISRPDKAKVRRAHVLGRMLIEGHINQSQFDKANQAPVKTFRHGAKTTVSAPYVAAMVRKDMIDRFGRDMALNDGLKVFTSVNPALQSNAQSALRSSLIEYDKRHGFRDVEQHYLLDESITEADRLTWLNDFQQIGQLIPALVINTTEIDAEVLLANGQHGKILLKDSLWAKKYIDENHKQTKKLTKIVQIINTGDVVRVMQTERFEKIATTKNKEQDLDDEQLTVADISLITEVTDEDLMTGSITENTYQPLPIYLLSQIPDANAGFVVLNPQNGSIEALVGGFNFSKNQFNMVTQARRQLGSNIKPFIYSSALAKGFTAADLINDSPIIHWDPSVGTFWRPENDNEIYLGPITLRHALRKSINTVSIRLIRKIGPRYAKKYLQKIGFPGKHMRAFDSLALGAASFTPLEVVTAYATLANGGYKVLPWYIDKIEDSHGNILFEQQATQVCIGCLEMIAREKQSALEKQQATETLESLIANETLENNALSVSDIDELSTIEPASSQGSINEIQSRISDTTSEIISSKTPLTEAQIAIQVIEPRNRYIINSMLQDVIHRGTAWRTLSNSKSPLLKRHDLAGKTGTTNDSKDAWFSGYNSQYVASAWVGFVDDRKLGNNEFGAKAALPIWQKFMEKALKNTPQQNLPRPDGIVDVKIDLSNGKLASANTSRSEFEVFRVENAPTDYSEAATEDVFDELDKLNKDNIEPVEEEIDF